MLFYLLNLNFLKTHGYQAPLNICRFLLNPQKLRDHVLGVLYFLLTC